MLCEEVAKEREKKKAQNPPFLINSFEDVTLSQAGENSFSLISDKKLQQNTNQSSPQVGFCKKSFTKKTLTKTKNLKNNFLLGNHLAPSSTKHFNHFEKITKQVSHNKILAQTPQETLRVANFF